MSLADHFLILFFEDLIEAHSIGHEPNLIDIYSASWGRGKTFRFSWTATIIFSFLSEKGPVDDGKTVDGPRHVTLKTMVKGINEVRFFVRHKEQFQRPIRFSFFFRFRAETDSVKMRSSSKSLITYLESFFLKVRFMFGLVAMVDRMMIVIVMVMLRRCGRSRSILLSTMVEQRSTMNLVLRH